MPEPTGILSRAVAPLGCLDRLAQAGAVAGVPAVPLAGHAEGAGAGEGLDPWTQDGV